MICMKWPVCQRSCRARPTRRCDGRLQAQSTPLASAPGPGLVLSCAPHRIPPLPPTPLRGTSSGRLPRRLHVLEHTIFCGLSLLSPDSWGGGARLTRAGASSFGSSWNPRVTWRRVSFVDDDREDRYSETWMRVLAMRELTAGLGPAGLGDWASPQRGENERQDRPEAAPGCCLGEV